MIDPNPLALIPLGLVQSASMVADTVVTISASPTGLQRWVDLMTSIASIVIALVLIVIATSLVPAAWNSKKVYRKINDVIEDFQDKSKPLAQHANNVMSNLDYVSTAVRADVERLQVTVVEAQTRLLRAAELAEERINQLNALLEVVQEESESLFIDTASTIRGVKAGAQALRRAEEEEWDEEEIDLDLAGSPTRPRHHHP